jgi:hypothetical protein
MPTEGRRVILNKVLNGCHPRWTAGGPERGRDELKDAYLLSAELVSARPGRGLAEGSLYPGHVMYAALPGPEIRHALFSPSRARLPWRSCHARL